MLLAVRSLTYLRLDVRELVGTKNGSGCALPCLHTCALLYASSWG
jgi:hypothetical protein